jgi:hypothetical protein
MEDLTINSLSDFIKVLMQKTLDKKMKDSNEIFWFRGEGNANFETQLIPSSYRVLASTYKSIEDDIFYSDNIKSIEGNISAEFHRKSLPFIKSKGIENTMWNRYFLMQHYGINTRLLDWSENALLALFFALCNKKYQDKDARVWILNPFHLNSFAMGTIIGKPCVQIIPNAFSANKKSTILSKDGNLNVEELMRTYLTMDFKRDEDQIRNVYLPIALYPSFLDERMTAQKACFTIFGNKINGLLSKEYDTRFYLDSITIPQKSRTRILNELTLLGVDFSSNYPDLDGLGKSINSKFEANFRDNRETIIDIIEKTQNKNNKESPAGNNV